MLLYEPLIGGQMKLGLQKLSFVSTLVVAALLSLVTEKELSGGAVNPADSLQAAESFEAIDERQETVEAAAAIAQMNELNLMLQVEPGINVGTQPVSPLGKPVPHR
jgi:hypothetical protein